MKLNGYGHLWLAAGALFLSPYLAAKPIASPMGVCASPSVMHALTQLRNPDPAGPSGYDLTRELVLNFGPRPAGSPAEKVAAEWTAAQLRSMGLDVVESQSFEFDGWQRGTADLTVLGNSPISLPVAALGGSSATPPSGSEALVVRFSSLAELDAAATESVKGRIVFLDGHMRRTRDRAGYQDAVVVRRDGAVHVARKGGLALIIRSIGTDQDRGPHAGWSRGADDVYRIPAVALSNDDADFLADYLTLKGSATVRLNSSAQKVPAMTSQNVIGQISATPATTDTVLIGAHIDSWDLGMGAEDDGAGMGVVMSAIQRLIPYRALLHRNVRVVLFGNEEQGGVGAKAYAEHASATTHHIVAAESDLGSGRVWRLQIPDPTHPSPIDMLLAKTVKPLGIELSLQAPSFGGTDVEPLAATGTALYDLDPDASEYFDIHHTERDMLGRVSKQNLDVQSRAFAILALLTATAPDTCLAKGTTHP
jgi:hypothetical protein